MGNKNLIITIEREYGSGGRIVGKKLAEELGIHFYDDDILKLASEKSAVGEQFFRLADEKAGNNLLYRLGGGRKIDLHSKPSPNDKLTSPENLFKFQSEVMRELAESEPCIFVGRAAGYVLDQDEDIERLIRLCQRSRQCLSTLTKAYNNILKFLHDSYPLSQLTAVNLLLFPNMRRSSDSIVISLN